MSCNSQFTMHNSQFGGWDKVQKTHFENGGVFDQIVKANSAK